LKRKNRSNLVRDIGADLAGAAPELRPVGHRCPPSVAIAPKHTRPSSLAARK
jgi:hypothetical protein